MGFKTYAPPYSRTRSKTDVSQTGAAHWDLTTFNGSCANPTANTVTPYRATVQTLLDTTVMTDIVTPAFEKSKGDGRIVNSPMTRTRVVTSTPLGSYSGDRSYLVATNCSGVWKDLWKGPSQTGCELTVGAADTPFAPTPSIDTESLINIAVTSAWAKADLSKAAALATLGEAKETIMGIIDVFRKLIKILLAFKRFEFQIGLKKVTSLQKEFSPQEIANMYMSFRYGLRPLYYDALQIIDAAKHHKYDYDRWTFRATKTETKRNTTSGTVIWNSEMKHSYASYTTRDVVVRAGVLCQVSEPSYAALWGLTNVVESAWELLPFSFIVDWFFNVGSTIASWTPNAGLKALASWYTIEDTVYQYSVVDGCTFTPIAGRRYINPHFILDCHRSTLTNVKSRVIDPSRKVFPTFDLKLDCLKLLDLVIIAKKIWAR